MTSDQATIGAFIVTALVALAALGRWVWPKIAGWFRAQEEMFGTINGRPEKVDRSGKTVEPAVPSLTYQLAELTRAVSDQAEQNTRISAVEQLAVEHGRRLDRLEGGAQFERMLTKAESMQAWRAVEAVADSTPPEGHES